MSEVEYLTFESSQYFSRSWKMLTHDKGWIKPVLLLTVGALVPVVGPLCVLGYALEWARLTAWGVRTAPKQNGVDLGGCLSAGWRAFVVMLVWGIIYGVACFVVSLILSFIPGVNVLWAIAQQVGSIFLGVIVTVAALRATIYQRIGAGLEFGEVFKMFKRDFGGIGRITGLNCVCGLVLGTIAVVVFSIVFAVVLGGSMGSIIQLANLSKSGYVSSSNPQLYLPLISQLITNGIPAAILCGLVVSFFANIINLVVTNACGLWMLQFDVASWGSESASEQGTAATAATPAPVADVPAQDEVVVETIIPVAPAAPAPEADKSEEPAEAPAVQESSSQSETGDQPVGDEAQPADDAKPADDSKPSDNGESASE